MKASEALINAKALISNPENWVQGEYALDEKHDTTEGDFTGATCFCALGAMLKSQGKSIAYPEYHLVGFNYLRESCVDKGWALVSDLNDNSDHSSVMKMFDDAIDLAIKDEN